MKIWIDLTNSPHVNFFARMISDLQKEHEVFLTSRPLANTIELLELHGFNYHLVGKHYGKNIVKKLLGFFVRVWQLFALLRRENIDVAISHSSFFSPLVARMLGVRSIYLNDNEHAVGNRISFIFADKIMVPEFLDIELVQRQWARREKIISYPGVKEGIYLWSYDSSSSSGFQLDGRSGKKTVFVRPEPRTAQYYSGEKNFIDDLLVQLKDSYGIVLLPRDEVQKEFYKQDRFAGIVVLEEPISLTDVMSNCDLFIGAGGTMTREAAVLGIPTISVYQDELLQVDKYLIKVGLMVHSKNPSVEFIINFLERSEKKLPDRQLLDKGKQAYELIKSTLLALTMDKYKAADREFEKESQPNA